MVRCLVIVIAALLTLASGPASAQTVRLDEYQHPSESKFKEFNQIYLKGVVDGFMAYSVADARNRFFCIPPTRAITIEQAEEIMLRYAEKKQLPGNVPIGVPLFFGLKEAFPCTRE
jgi:Ssp1 endopeptidase immunity protein Rap1a